MNWQLLGMSAAGSVSLLFTVRMVVKMVSNHLLVRRVIKDGQGRIEIRGSTIIYDPSAVRPTISGAAEEESTVAVEGYELPPRGIRRYLRWRG